MKVTVKAISHSHMLLLLLLRLALKTINTLHQLTSFDLQRIENLLKFFHHFWSSFEAGRKAGKSHQVQDDTMRVESSFGVQLDVVRQYLTDRLRFLPPASPFTNHRATFESTPTYANKDTLGAVTGMNTLNDRRGWRWSGAEVELTRRSGTINIFVLGVALVLIFLGKIGYSMSSSRLQLPLLLHIQQPVRHSAQTEQYWALFCQ